MLNNYEMDFREITRTFTDKDKNKMQLEILLNLLKKLNTYEDITIENKIKEVLEILSDYNFSESETKINNNSTLIKTFKKEFSSLKKLVSTRLGLIERGLTKNKIMGFSMSLGVAIGVALSSKSPAMLSIGIALGIAIGAGLGSKKEKELEDSNNLY